MWGLAGIFSLLLDIFAMRVGAEMERRRMRGGMNLPSLSPCPLSPCPLSPSPCPLSLSLPAHSSHSPLPPHPPKACEAALELDEEQERRVQLLNRLHLRRSDPSLHATLAHYGLQSPLPAGVPDDLRPHDSIPEEVMKKQEVLREITDIRSWQWDAYVASKEKRKEDEDEEEIVAKEAERWNAGFFPSHVTIYKSAHAQTLSVIADRVTEAALHEGVEVALQSVAEGERKWGRNVDRSLEIGAPAEHIPSSPSPPPLSLTHTLSSNLEERHLRDDVEDMVESFDAFRCGKRFLSKEHFSSNLIFALTVSSFITLEVGDMVDKLVKRAEDDAADDLLANLQSSQPLRKRLRKSVSFHDKPNVLM